MPEESSQVKIFFCVPAAIFSRIFSQSTIARASAWALLSCLLTPDAVTAWLRAFVALAHLRLELSKLDQQQAVHSNPLTLSYIISLPFSAPDHTGNILVSTLRALSQFSLCIPALIHTFVDA